MPSFNCLIGGSEEIMNYCPKWDICQEDLGATISWCLHPTWEQLNISSTRKRAQRETEEGPLLQLPGKAQRLSGHLCTYSRRKCYHPPCPLACCEKCGWPKPLISFPGPPQSKHFNTTFPCSPHWEPSHPHPVPTFPRFQGSFFMSKIALMFWETQRGWGGEFVGSLEKSQKEWVLSAQHPSPAQVRKQLKSH